MTPTLREYQIQTAMLMAQNMRYYNAMQQRVGKTPTTILACQLVKAKNILCVVPNSLKLNWEMEFNQWSDYPVTVVKGSKEQREDIIANFKGGVLILHYDYIECVRDTSKVSKGSHLLSENQRRIMRHTWDVLICDEAHLLNNRYSLRSMGIKDFSKRIKYFWPLSGTPIRKGFADIWAVMHMINPIKFSSYQKFIDLGGATYGLYGKEVPEKPETPSVIRNLITPHMVRILLKDVRGDLPPVTYQKVWIDLEESEKRVYNALWETWGAELNDGTEISVPVILALYTRLKQITLSPDLILMNSKQPNAKQADESIEYEEEGVIKTKGGHSYNTAKYKALLDYVEGMDEKFVIFSQFEKGITLAEKMFNKYKIPVLRITGKENTEQRHENLRLFNEHKGQVGMLCTYQAGGVGLNMTAASVIFSLDRLYVPSDNEQGYARIQGEGQVNPCTIIEFFAKETVDEKIEARNLDRDEMVKVLLGLSDKTVEVIGK